MVVIKFGGTSVANAENIKLILKIIEDKAIKDRVVVVLSAFSGVTDLLLKSANLAASHDELYKTVLSEIEERHFEVVKNLVLANEQAPVISEVEKIISHLATLLDGCYLLSELSPRTSDTIVGFGELLSSYIISQVFKIQFPESIYKDGRELIKTDNRFGKANVNFTITNEIISRFFSSSSAQVTFIPGFIAASDDGHNTTLGRGGSDYTAAILAAAISAKQLEIWTDVNGMFTANPTIVRQAKPIETITYHEAMELSHFGAKVLYPPTIQPVLSKNIPIFIKNTFAPDHSGTIISSAAANSENPIKGITHISDVALITLEGSGMIGVAGSSKRLFEVVSNAQINVIFITQASSEHSICIGILNQDAKMAKQIIDRAFDAEIAKNSVAPCIVEMDLCIVALVGENMKNHQGISGKMFSTLGKNNVNIRAIAQGASERNISVVINERDVKKALNTLHERFFEDNTKQLNLFVMGLGNVGEKFIDQMQQQEQFLKDNLKINIRVIAMSNSRKMHFDEEGINLNNWKEFLADGELANTQVFIAEVKKRNLRNSIFIDITANEAISRTYEYYLKENIAVVTCNKIACSSPYENYKQLKNLSRRYNAPFLFETNVGAGLPIIDTLKHLIVSGDKVHKIQAVLSGSLNFIFNNFDHATNFHDVVKEAGVQGFTEPDPKIDLSGVDVARKILILIRESGYQMEMTDIDNESFLPPECLNTSDNESFFSSLIAHASHFENLYDAAEQKGCRLKYVAKFENGRASVGLQLIPPTHPFYNLEGKDNIVLFYTDRYVDQPLLIKGAGAGAAVTASGIFADVIRIGNV